MEGVDLVPFSFQFVLGLATVFAEECNESALFLSLNVYSQRPYLEVISLKTPCIYILTFS